VKFDYKILGVRLLLGTVIVTVTLLSQSFGLAPRFVSADQIVQFCIAVYGTVIACDFDAFKRSQEIE
jgi:hypothetical protein